MKLLACFGFALALYCCAAFFVAVVWFMAIGRLDVAGALLMVPLLAKFGLLLLRITRL